MEIKLNEIKIKDLYDGYIDEGEDGVFAFDEKLSVRPPYQRELVYPEILQAAVIDSILKGYPINVMYWMIIDKEKRDPESTVEYELLDGQQRTLSICRYIDGDFPVKVNGSPKFYSNLTADERRQINEYKLLVYFCEGDASERLQWFKVINTVGMALTDQEIRNAVYTGPWVMSAKKVFSKTGCYAYNLGSNYMKGETIRQDYLETVLKWACNKDHVDTIEEYMATHQSNANANDLKKYFTDVIEWVEDLFPDYKAHMKGLPWGILYNKYHSKTYDKDLLKQDLDRLMGDYEVQKKTNIYEYLLGGQKDQKLLNLRAFDEPTKRAQYAAQGGVCPMCGRHFEYEEMHGDHKTAWINGGKTVPENCQMLCTECNLQKKAQDASFV